MILFFSAFSFKNTTLESGIDVAPGKLDQIQIEKTNQPWKSLANGKNPKIYERGKVYSGL